MLLGHQNLRFYCLKTNDRIINRPSFQDNLLITPCAKHPGLVEDSGVEPLTSCLQSRRSTS
uniref:Uncharacterized protein n=1 Tax=uncultured delta proteobacterium HF0200_39N20 TaxID=710833 RepID=E0XUV3_9DELT|nr:hypothetical protein [uncultured delta proteobacterium HF0200_39N20]